MSMHVSSFDALIFSIYLSRPLKSKNRQLWTRTHEPKSSLKPFTNKNNFQIIASANSFKAEHALIFPKDTLNTKEAWQTVLTQLFLNIQQ